VPERLIRIIRRVRRIAGEERWVYGSEMPSAALPSDLDVMVHRGLLIPGHSQHLLSMIERLKCHHQSFDKIIAKLMARKNEHPEQGPEQIIDSLRVSDPRIQGRRRVPPESG